ncbi:DEAD/DEAH box helicase [bacterium]|nr:DEAD/DEAH box helicase [bacterium]
MNTPLIQSFDELKLDPKISKALAALKFTSPTPIQGMSLPHSILGKDVQGEASTGSGKTLAFLLAIFEQIQKNPHHLSLILVPTRELVTQVGQVIEDFQKVGLRASWTGLIGGSPLVPQIRRLKKFPNIIVGTPGRVNDHLNRGTLELEHLKTFVLDEADRMLDMGFAPQIDAIKRHFPKKTHPQTLFFSATYPPTVNRLVGLLLRQPVKVTAVSKDIAKPDIDQDAFHMDKKDKYATLCKQLEKREGSILIFVQRKYDTEKLAVRLNKQGINVACIHGGLNQGQRNRTIQAFRDERTLILVATDVAARGLDIDHVNHVINYDLPQQAEDYVHRIGRTGRAGRKGEALSFVTDDDRQVWLEIVKIIKVQLEQELPMFFKPIAGRPSSNRKPSGRGASGGGGNRSGGAPKRGGKKPFRRSDRADSKATFATRSERPSRDGASPRSARPARTDRTNRGERSDRPTKPTGKDGRSYSRSPSGRPSSAKGGKPQRSGSRTGGAKPSGGNRPGKPSRKPSNKT